MTINNAVLNAFPDVSAPEIVSEPVTQATAEFPYQYLVVGEDPDLGDSLNYSIAGEPGSSIDSMLNMRMPASRARLISPSVLPTPA